MFMNEVTHPLCLPSGFVQASNHISVPRLFSPGSALSRELLDSSLINNNGRGFPECLPSTCSLSDLTSSTTLSTTVNTSLVSAHQQQQSYNSSVSLKVDEDDVSVLSAVSQSDSIEGTAVACPDCGKVFTERSLLARHRVSHAAAKYICHLCSRPFVRDDKLKRHIRCVHSSERPFKCEFCSKAFARKDKLQEHTRHHNRDITFTCPVCAELFVMRSHLNRHLRGVHKLKLTQHVNSTTSVADSNAATTTTADLSGNGLGSCGSKSAFTPVASLTIADAVQSFNPLCSNASDVLAFIQANAEAKTTKSRRKSIAKRRFLNNSSPLSGTLDQLNPQSPHFAQPSPPLSAFSAPVSTTAHFPGNFLLSSTNTAAHHSQQHHLHHHQQQVQPDSLQAISAHLNPHAHGGRPAVYGSSDSQYSLTNQPYLPTQSPQHPQQAAWSAAMAASLFAPVNYVGWWSQPSSNLTRSAHHSSGPFGSNLIYTPGSAATDAASTAYTTSNSVRSSSESLVQTSPSTTNCNRDTLQHSFRTPTDSTHIPTASFSSANPQAHMFAALPSFAQAMYYQAASWVATQNNNNSGGAGALGDTQSSVWDPRFPSVPYSSSQPAVSNDNTR
ncbi:Zinc finger protein [Paragonimus skrjabini miyazakii]|uniref:Zinc finger protein n=1 Tax=Paragonimus skrjabini miyazakii TaxID=59628 RepID=A0A8S9YXJ8_9TREM|nr:Zinc finger protein [Paragonimus skrjabini miyazakii]